MELFLQHGSTTVSANVNSDESETDNEVSLKNMVSEVDLGSENATSKDSWEYIEAEGQTHGTEQQDNTSSNSGNRSAQTTLPKTEIAKTERAALKEIQDPEAKMQAAKEGSTEKMLLEMCLDIKRDNLEVMKKMDKVSASTDTLQHKVSKLK